MILKGDFQTILSFAKIFVNDYFVIGGGLFDIQECCTYAMVALGMCRQRIVELEQTNILNYLRIMNK